MDNVVDDYEKLYGMFKKYQKLGFQQMKNDIITNAISKSGYKTPFHEADLDTQKFRSEKYSHY
jgi:hypothetical protein